MLVEMDMLVDMERRPVMMQVTPRSKFANRLLIANVLFAALICLVATSNCFAQIDNGPDSRPPGDAPAWAILSKSYDVDNSKAAAVKENVRTSTIAYTTHFVLTGPNQEPVPGGFMRPKADGIYPVVLLLHGLSSDKDTMLKVYGVPLLNNGFAVLALDAPHHGERKKADVNQMDTANFAESVHEGCREYRRVLDWLAQRKDVDPKRIGLLGYSMGSITGAILAAVDPRIQDLVLCVGGDPIVSFAPNIPEGKRDAMYSICPSLFIGHVAPHKVLMLNGRRDSVMAEPAVDRLFGAAKQPKNIEWFDSDHVLPHQHVIRAVSWLADQLNPAPKTP